ncbi:MAG: TRAP transporter small permease [Firmicutes bacterium]|nr:TRAP transporter small permease [Bacillota bacterium]
MEKIKKIYLNFFEVYSKLAGVINKICVNFGILLLVAVTIVVLFTIFYRYLLGSSLRWGEEVARYLLIWLTLIVSSVAIKDREHISFTSITDRLGKKTALIIEIILYIIIVTLLGLILKNSYMMVITRSIRKLSPAVQMNMLWPHSALPVGFAVIILQSVYIILEDIKELIKE